MKQAPRQIKEIVASNIRAARVGADMTQRELARAVNDVPPLAVYRWEAGATVPNGENFAALADALGHEIAWFYTDHGNESPGGQVGRRGGTDENGAGSEEQAA